MIEQIKLCEIYYNTLYKVKGYFLLLNKLKDKKVFLYGKY